MEKDKDLQEWQSLWKEQASNPKDITIMINQLNKIEQKNKQSRIAILITFTLTIIALLIVMPVMENPFYMISIACTGIAMLIIIYQVYKNKFAPIKDEADFSNKQFLESHIQKLKGGMELTSKYMWIYAVLIIAGINFGYLAGFAGHPFGFRFLIHLTVSAIILILFYVTIKKHKTKNDKEIVPLIEQLEAMNNE